MNSLFKLKYLLKREQIDIVISGRGNDHNKFIIIENKIYHSLNNDLNDYWNNFNCETDKKIGITFKIKINQNNAKFINILHTELLNEVRSYIDLTSLNQKQEFYFENFSDALNNLSKDLNMNTQAKFTKTVQQLIKQLNQKQKQKYIQTHQKLLLKIQVAKETIMEENIIGY